MPTKRMKDAYSQEEIHIPILEWKEREIEKVKERERKKERMIP